MTERIHRTHRGARRKPLPGHPMEKRSACLEHLWPYEELDLLCGLGDGHLGEHRAQTEERTLEWLDGRRTEVTVTTTYRWPIKDAKV